MAPASSEQNFRTNLQQFRWSRGVTDDSQPQQAQQSSNPFSRFYQSIAGDYVPLRSSERSNEEEAWFALSSWERLLGFGACLIGAAVCFFIAFLTILRCVLFTAIVQLIQRYIQANQVRAILQACSPRFLTLKLYLWGHVSLGSLLVMFGFSVLIGPINHIKHLVSKERLPFTIVYFGSLGATLYFSLGLHSFLGSLICGVVQVVALLAYVLAYFPGGTQTLRLGGQMAARGAGSLLPL
ncbi:related to SFT2/YBL102W [Armillaria ostoyae]|uniref:Protein transport protein SFT2 n=1 Tax=Armillaria ostoyae TaxID=47428 RepID=A0A284RHZ5_ARMOS|nr:related to SFT2/YBL102W [Armillaria ostoyae]